MSSHLRRLKAIELALTPKQIVLLWLKAAQKAGSFKEGGLQLPHPRGAIVNAMLKTVRNCMKGQAEQLIERAVRQAREEADFLYLLVVTANLAVLETLSRRKRECLLLFGYFGAVVNGPKSGEVIMEYHSELVTFVEDVLTTQAAIAQTTAQLFDNHELLFSDTSRALTEQLEMAKQMSLGFNTFARQAGVAEIDTERVQTSIRPKVDQQVSSWITLARLETLSTFGEEETWRAGMITALSALEAEPD